MSIEQINPQAAWDKMQQPESAAYYLDVRTTQEFQMGHAKAAHNIPILIINPQTQQMQPNPNFLQQVQETFSPETPLVVGCKMGGRSQMACDLLAKAGFSNLSNIMGGFDGAPGQPGWHQLGLPIENT